VEVIGCFSNGALIEGPCRPELPLGCELTFTCADVTGRVVIDSCWCHIDGRSAFYSARPAGPDCEIRPAHPWFVGARWSVSIPSVSRG
jgi:hypothetical protein